jgi:hypothetical protein
MNWFKFKDGQSKHGRRYISSYVFFSPSNGISPTVDSSISSNEGNPLEMNFKLSS